MSPNPASLIALAVLVTVAGIPLTVPGDEQARSPDRSEVLPGVVMPKRTVTVFPALPGTVSKVLAHEGEFVEQDADLVALDDRVAVASMNSAEIASQQTGPLELAQAELEEAEQHQRRLAGLKDPRAVARRDFEDNVSAIAKAKANLRTAKENLDLAKSRFDVEREKVALHKIRAPFAGVVQRVQVTEGQKVIDSTPMLEIVDVRVLKVELFLPLELALRLHKGEEYWLSAELHGVDKLQGKLVAISHVLDPGTKTVRAIFEIDNSDEQLPAGFLVSFDEKASEFALLQE